MIQTDLFISYSDFYLGSSLYFPYKEVVNYIVQLPTNTGHISLSNISVSYNRFTSNTEVSLTFSDNRSNKLCYTEDAGVTHDDNYVLALFDSQTAGYCGCMEITEVFHNWLRSIPLGSFDVEPDSLILHPGKYFYYDLSNVNIKNDVRFRYLGEPIDRLEFPDFTVNLDGSIDKQEDSTEYTEQPISYFILRESNYYEKKVWGPNVSIYISPDSGNRDTRIVTTPGTITITDFEGDR